MNNRLKHYAWLIIKRIYLVLSEYMPCDPWKTLKDYEIPSQNRLNTKIIFRSNPVCEARKERMDKVSINRSYLLRLVYKG